MRNRNAKILTGLVLCVCLIPTSNAQLMHERIREGSVAIVCRVGSTASHIKDDCDYPRTEMMGIEGEKTATIEITLDNSRACGALVDVMYSQRDTFVHLEGTLDTGECGASRGRYTVSAKIRRAGGAVETIDFEEQWERSDNLPIALEADYPIGDDAELLRLGIHRVSCACER